jgi:hypothetical protein
MRSTTQQHISYYLTPFEVVRGSATKTLSDFTKGSIYSWN